MINQEDFSRRVLVKSSVLGVLVASLPGVMYARNILAGKNEVEETNASPHDRHPAIQLSVAAEVVGVSHFNFDRLKELVEPRPELANATWDWGFGDWESAIGAASHVGRRDIVDYLVSKGAVPTLFTYAMLGDYNTVKTMISAYPGVQKNTGPHGISLLRHAVTGLEAEGGDKTRSQLLVDYLKSLGDADGKTYADVPEAEKAKFLGDYKYGEGKDDGFTIKLNTRKMLSLGKLGKSGGTLLPVGNNEFAYQGAPSVTVKFAVENNKVISLTLNEPGLTLTAAKL